MGRELTRTELPVGPRTWLRVGRAESAIGRIAGSTERRDRTTTVAVLAAAQNGTSGVLADGKHP